MARSILTAVRQGNWGFEPEVVTEDRFQSTQALPGTKEKVRELARRAKEGLPLWHSGDGRVWDPGEHSFAGDPIRSHAGS
jgi:hypothetical protein